VQNIYRIDQLGCKEVKESIFLVEARESEQQKIASLGLQNHPQPTIEVQVSYIFVSLPESSLKQIFFSAVRNLKCFLS
jgi:hypothetical protein